VAVEHQLRQLTHATDCSIVGHQRRRIASF